MSRLARSIATMLALAPAAFLPTPALASTTSMVMAVGATLPFGELYIPANLAVAFAEGGPRITTLIGWIVG